jgi:hypothetical protein
MTRFADPLATATVVLGPCQCPGTPHEQDEATIRTQLGASALSRIGRAEIDGAVRGDHFAAYRRLVLEATQSWNLLWPNPAIENEDDERKPVPVPINEATVELLDNDTLRTLAETIDGYTNSGPDPNDSGGRSPGSRRPRRSSTPTSTPTPGT